MEDNAMRRELEAREIEFESLSKGVEEPGFGASSVFCLSFD